MTVKDLVNTITTRFPYIKYYYFELLTITFIVSFAYLFYSLIPIHVFIAFLFFAGSGYCLLKGKWDHTVKQGIILN